MHWLVVVGLLCISNVLMTFAWYWHIKSDRPPFAIWQIVLISWGIALLEYSFAVPANHFGAQWGIKPFQLKIMQEVITLAVFVPFAVFYMGQPLKWDYLWAGLCLVGAVYFIFRSA